MNNPETLPFTKSQLQFCRTSSFDEEAYDFNESAELAAKKRGLIVVYPLENQLQIDVDSEAQRQEVYSRIEAMNGFEFWDAKVEERPSPSGRPGRFHITISLGGVVLTEWQRIAIQSVLGSDPMREFLNCMRAMDGVEKATRLFEKP